MSINPKELANLDVKNDIVKKSHIDTKTFQFAKTFTFDQRREQVQRLQETSPGRVAVVIEISPIVHKELHQHHRDDKVFFERFKATPDNTVAEMAMLARQRFFRTDVPANAGVFLYVGDSADIAMCSLSAPISSFLKKRNPDGWLYFLLTVEATFGQS